MAFAVAHGDVLLEHRGEAHTALVIGVLLRAYAEEPDVEQPHRAGQDPFRVRLPIAPQDTQHPPAQSWQHPGEVHHVVELPAILALAPARVIEVLLAAGGVDAGGSCRWPRGSGQIQTSLQAGGIASSLSRSSSSGSRTGRPRVSA